MKLNVLLILTGLSILFSSWTMDRHDKLNINSWSISIGKDILLGSHKNNKMGDTALVDKTKYKITDTLFANHYLCGSLGRPAVTTLIIKNQQAQIIKEKIHSSTEWHGTGSVKLSELNTLIDFKSGQVIDIFLTIDFTEDDQVSNPVLLGRLKIK